MFSYKCLLNNTLYLYSTFSWSVGRQAVSIVQLFGFMKLFFYLSVAKRRYTLSIYNKFIITPVFVNTNTLLNTSLRSLRLASHPCNGKHLITYLFTIIIRLCACDYSCWINHVLLSAFGNSNKHLWSLKFGSKELQYVYFNECF